MITIRRLLEGMRTYHSDIIVFHQTGDTFFTDCKAKVTQLIRHAFTPIGLVIFFMNSANIAQQSQVFALSFRHGTFTPIVITTGADIEGFTKQIQRMFGFLFINEFKPHRFWLAKNSVAFFRICRSVRFASPLLLENTVLRAKASKLLVKVVVWAGHQIIMLMLGDPFI